MPYIVVPIDFFERDERMRKLMFRFGGRSAALPIRLWCLAAQQSPRDGRLAEHSIETLELALGWTGRRGELEHALVEAGFLEKMPRGYRVFNWDQEQGHIWRNHVRACKAARALHRKEETVDATSIATSRAPSTA
jgi:hypothetical protein